MRRASLLSGLPGLRSRRVPTLRAPALDQGPGGATTLPITVASMTLDD